jgi:hypothetical protein
MAVFAHFSVAAEEGQECAIHPTKVTSLGVQCARKGGVVAGLHPGAGSGAEGIGVVIRAKGKIAVEDNVGGYGGAVEEPEVLDELEEEGVLFGGGGGQGTEGAGKEFVVGILGFGVHDEAFGVEPVAAAIASGSDFARGVFWTTGEAAIGSGGGDLS